MASHLNGLSGGRGVVSWAVLSLLWAAILAARLQGQGDIAQQMVAEQKKIDQTIVEPCKTERTLKAAEIQRDVIDVCGCSSSVKQQHTRELNATLQIELRRCEQRGADALDQYKHAAVSRALDDFNRFNAQLNVDRQILQNFGFNRTVGEIESWADYGEKGQNEYTRQAQNEVLSKLLQSIQLKAQAMTAVPQITSQKAVSLYNLFKATGVRDKALFDALAAAGRGDPQIPERMLWLEITSAMEKLNDARGVLNTRDDPLSIFNSVLTVASWMAPEILPYVSIVKDATWIGYATYTHAEVAHGLYTVDRLTTLTEAQLKDLEPVTRRLKQDVDGLVAAKKILEWAKSATDNGSGLVRTASD